MPPSDIRLAALAAIVHIVKKALAGRCATGFCFNQFGRDVYRTPMTSHRGSHRIQEPFVQFIGDAGFTPILAVKSTSQHGSAIWR